MQVGITKAFELQKICCFLHFCIFHYFTYFNFWWLDHTVELLDGPDMVFQELLESAAKAWCVPKECCFAVPKDSYHSYPWRLEGAESRQLARVLEDVWAFASIMFKFKLLKHRESDLKSGCQCSVARHFPRLSSEKRCFLFALRPPQIDWSAGVAKAKFEYLERDEAEKKTLRSHIKCGRIVSGFFWFSGYHIFTARLKRRLQQLQLWFCCTFLCRNYSVNSLERMPIVPAW